MTRPKRVLPPSVAADMENVIAETVFTYFNEFTAELFPNYRDPQAQEIILNGFAQAIRKYETTIGIPLTKTLAFNLLDVTKEPSQ